MKRFVTASVASLLFAFSSMVLAQESKKVVELAPAPSAMLSAQKIFIKNGGSPDEVYDLFYAEMKVWGRYKLAGSPEEADLVFEISFGSQGDAPKVYTNPATLRTYSYTVDKLELVVYDPKTHNAIWSSTETPESARREKNRDKNRIKAVKNMVGKLRRRVEETKHDH